MQHLKRLLHACMQQQGWRSVRVTPEVRSAVTSLFSGDIGRLVSIDAWLSKLNLARRSGGICPRGRPASAGHD